MPRHREGQQGRRQVEERARDKEREEDGRMSQKRSWKMVCPTARWREQVELNILLLYLEYVPNTSATGFPLLEQVNK